MKTLSSRAVIQRASLVVLTMEAVLVSPISAQSVAAPEVTIDELRAPADPAFVLLDISPTSIEQPSTPRALGLSLLRAVEENRGDLPEDLALHLAPYWMKSRPVTFEEYYKPNKGIAATIAQTLSVSVATSDFTVGGADKGSRAGLGFRFLLRHGRAAPGLQDKIQKLRDLQSRLLDECVPNIGQEVDQGCVAKFEPLLHQAAKEITQLDKDRRGLQVEVSSAVAADIPEDDTAKLDVNRYAAWLTLSYRPTTSNLVFLGAGRYIRDERQSENDIYDLGARFIWKSDKAVLPLAISIEHLERFRKDEDDTDRTVAVVEYVLPFENLSLIASYGKTFDDSFNGKGDLVSTLGIKLGFGKGPVVKLPQ